MPTNFTGDNFIPSVLTAGDTWDFTLSFPNYPANAGWSAVWHIGCPNKVFSFTAAVATNGTDFRWLIPGGTGANTTGAFSPAIYGYRFIVIGSGAFAGQQFQALPAPPSPVLPRVTVQANLGSLSVFDVRTSTEIELTQLQATILALENNQVQSATFSGQTFTSQDLEKLRAREVQLIERIKQQTAQANAAAGRGSGRNCQIRFVEPIANPGSTGIIQLT